MSGKKGPRVTYGEGPRAQYGEGTRYRPEDMSEAVQESTDHGFAGGARKKKPIPDANKPADDCR